MSLHLITTLFFLLGFFFLPLDCLQQENNENSPSGEWQASWEGDDNGTVTHLPYPRSVWMQIINWRWCRTPAGLGLMSLFSLASHFPAHLWSLWRTLYCPVPVWWLQPVLLSQSAKIRNAKSGEEQSKYVLLFVSLYMMPVQTSPEQPKVQGPIPLLTVSGFVVGRGWEFCRSNRSHSNSLCSCCGPLRAVVFLLWIYLVIFIYFF